MTEQNPATPGSVWADPPDGLVPEPGARPAAPPLPANGVGRAGLVTGVVAIVLCWVIVGGFIGIIALVLGLVGLGRARRGTATNRGTAWAAVALGALSTLIAGLVVAGLWTFYSQHRDDFQAYQSCKRAATTDQQRSDCVSTLKNALTG